MVSQRLTQIDAICNYLCVTDVSVQAPVDSTLELAERQLAMLGRLALLAMEVSEAFASSAKASAKAEESILADEYFMPEVGRARACGAKDAAESFQKVTRAVRLTLKLEMAVAEIVRDIRAGVVTHSGWVMAGKDAGGDHGAPAEGPRSFGQSAGALAGSCSPKETPDRDRRDRDVEHLIDIERPDILLRAPFRETVDSLCADIGAAVHWSTLDVQRARLHHEAPQPKPAHGSACRDSSAGCACDLIEPENSAAALPP